MERRVALRITRLVFTPLCEGGTPQPITVTADAYDQLVDAIDAPARTTPKLDALMAHEPRWC